MRDRIQKKYYNTQKNSPTASTKELPGVRPKNKKADGNSMMMLQENKKFFKRQSRNVKETYLFSQDELKQKFATINLFEKFDADGSGALDPQELTILYNENGVKVTEEEIGKLYDDDNVKFTLAAFESMSKDSQRLRKYRQALKQFKYRLEAQAHNDTVRGYVPATFDSMMLDFGNRVQRKELIEKFDLSSEELVSKSPAMRDVHENKEMITEHTDIMKQLFDTTAASLSLMSSAENELFRRARTKAMHEKAVQQKIGEKFKERFEIVRNGGCFIQPEKWQKPYKNNESDIALIKSPLSPDKLAEN